MTVELALIEHALQGLTMDVVINLTEHVQTLELRPNGQLFTAYRDIDQTLLIGYSDDLAAEKLSLSQRHFYTTGTRRGTKREHRLLLHTLKDLNIRGTYNESCFPVNNDLIKNLINLNWPVGEIKTRTTQSLQEKNYE
jgi:hypothetical protein